MAITLDQLAELISSTSLTLEKSLDNSKSHFRIGTTYYDPKETRLFKSFKNADMRLFNNEQSANMKNISSKKSSATSESQASIKNERTSTTKVDLMPLEFTNLVNNFSEVPVNSDKSNQAKLNDAFMMTVA
ncbi:hypothetical protein HAU47_06755 [Weissella confusa]|uniref:hypothetical protein n=1 Tax=Weissella confusa TaxID=1583 RepID=UPI0018F1B841|nr:hypothetical protein [Weissella confusa]MBJ7620170.1 hypothetical protein [Weissella confusa]MBJ7667618.1 hypothetical protein [Weissella confusa]MCT0026114.1 hypothetical protein [Weissella confusa]